LREENAALGKTLERASQLVAVPWESSNVGGLPLFFSVLPGVPRELVTVASRRWSDDNPDALVLLLMPEAEGKGGYFLFYRGKEVDRDFSSFLRESPSLAAKGGGRSDWLNGASPCMRPEEWREAIARFLST
jgi:alanyl-tRNA synthetase